MPNSKEKPGSGQQKVKKLSSGERVLLDVHRARRGLGRDFGRHDPQANYYLKRAKVSALLEIGKALRRDEEISLPVADTAEESTDAS